MTKRDQPFVCLDVLAALIEKPCTVDELVGETGAKEPTVRDGLKALETVGLARLAGTKRHYDKGIGRYVYAAMVKKDG
jgi:DNA-binding IclR family transcriptional regulator